MAAIQKKSAPQTFMDNCFVVFSQGYLIEQVKAYIEQRGVWSGKKGSQPRVLDIGCYDGRLFAFMSQSWTYTEYVGVDYQQKYLDMAFTKQSDRFKLMQCDITSGLPFPDSHFDVVVSSEVFEHIESKNYPFIMSEIYRVLTPKGRAILGFPMNTLNKQFHSVEKELKSLGHVDFPVHETFIDTGKNAGFDFVNYDSSFATSSSWRIPKETKASKEYKAIRRTLGAAVARSIMMILSEDHTGGGFYTFDKPDTNT